MTLQEEYSIIAVVFCHEAYPEFNHEEKSKSSGWRLLQEIILYSWKYIKYKLIKYQERLKEFFQVKVTKETWKLYNGIPRLDTQFIKDIIIIVSVIRTECVNVMVVIY